MLLAFAAGSGLVRAVTGDGGSLTRPLHPALGVVGAVDVAARPALWHDGRVRTHLHAVQLTRGERPLSPRKNCEVVAGSPHTWAMGDDGLCFHHDPSGAAVRATYPPRLAPPAAGAVLALLAVLGLFGVWALGEAVRPRRWRLAVTGILYAAGLAALLEGVGTVVAENAINTLGNEARELATSLLTDGPGFHNDRAAHFEPHPYLGYALRPDHPERGRARVHPDLLIRRSEPLRPRSEVATRILALGGSTTFGTFLNEEAATWPHQLEASLREQHGPGVDVINGGVPGYTVVENSIHDLLLLNALEADIVLLTVGLNDLEPRLRGRIRADYANYKRLWPEEGWVVSPAPTAARRWGLVRAFWVESQRAAFYGPHILELVTHPAPDMDDWQEALRRNGPDVFETHLRNLVARLTGAGKAVVLVPQLHLDTSVVGSLLAEGRRAHAESMRRVAAEFDLLYVDDADDPAQFKPWFLFDSCHFNAEGGARLAAMLEDAMRQAGVLSPVGAAPPPTAGPG